MLGLTCSNTCRRTFFSMVSRLVNSEVGVFLYRMAASARIWACTCLASSGVISLEGGFSSFPLILTYAKPFAKTRCSRAITRMNTGSLLYHSLGFCNTTHQERHLKCYCVVSSQYPEKTYENTGLKKAIAFRIIPMIAEPVAIFEALKTMGGVGPEGTGLTSLATNPTPEIA